MLYKVKAKFNSKLLSIFFKKLTDGTVEKQKPDGLEIIKSMKNAKIAQNKTIQWYEKCFCATPLKHERESIYDTYFFDIETHLVDKIEDNIEGNSFWNYMKNNG